MLRAAVIVGVTVSLVCAGGAAAQRRATARRDGSGFWYGFGLGAGWARVTCAICAGHRAGGLSAFAALGGSTSRNVRIGAELAAWRHRGGNVTQTLGAIGVAAYWFPTPRRRLYLKGGAALVTHRTEDGTDVITSSGIGPLMGIGYESRFGRKWTLAPFFHYGVGVIGGGVKSNGAQAADRATVSFVQLGVSLTRP
ncbi:MAG TPA: hypothetical protein VGQ25_05680 [Gemmatimonadales bacterium]|jgi:hypothetical protein|nr:hypothetical protein [Gemmatimonadales bacterium]